MVSWRDMRRQGRDDGDDDDDDDDDRLCKRLQHIARRVSGRGNQTSECLSWWIYSRSDTPIELMHRSQHHKLLLIVLRLLTSHWVKLLGFVETLLHSSRQCRWTHRMEPEQWHGAIKSSPSESWQFLQILTSPRSCPSRFLSSWSISLNLTSLNSRSKVGLSSQLKLFPLIMRRLRNTLNRVFDAQPVEVKLLIAVSFWMLATDEWKLASLIRDRNMKPIPKVTQICCGQHNNYNFRKLPNKLHLLSIIIFLLYTKHSHENIPEGNVICNQWRSFMIFEDVRCHNTDAMFMTSLTTFYNCFCCPTKSVPSLPIASEEYT